MKYPATKKKSKKWEGIYNQKKSWIRIWGKGRKSNLTQKHSNYVFRAIWFPQLLFAFLHSSFYKLISNIAPAKQADRREEGKNIIK